MLIIGVGCISVINSLFLSKLIRIVIECMLKLYLIIVVERKVIKNFYVFDFFVFRSNCFFIWSYGSYVNLDKIKMG